MNDDELLEALGARERDEIAGRAPEWDEVANGRLRVQDAVARIRARGPVDEDELERAAELFAPLDEAFDDAIAAKILDGPIAASPEIATVVRRDRGFWRRGGIAAALGAVAAAALLVWIVRPEPSATGPGMLPAYELGVGPARATVRGDHADGTVSVGAGEDMLLLLRPATEHEHTPSVWACLERDDRRVPIDVAVQSAPPGATIVAHATIPSSLEPGAWSLVAVVATASPSEDPCALDDAPTHRVSRAALAIETAEPSR